MEEYMSKPAYWAKRGRRMVHIWKHEARCLSLGSKDSFRVVLWSYNNHKLGDILTQVWRIVMMFASVSAFEGSYLLISGFRDR